MQGFGLDLSRTKGHGHKVGESKAKLERARKVGPAPSPHCSILGDTGDLQGKVTSFTTQQDLQRLKK